MQRLEQLQCLSRWPASVTLPPRWEDVASSVRDCFRRLRDRCKAPSSCTVVDSAIHSCIATLWELVQSTRGGPVSGAVLASAKQWIAEHNFFVSVFDHNLSTLALVCRKLAYHSACKLLDFGPYAHDAADHVWERACANAVQSLLRRMARVPGLPRELAPAATATVPKALWRIGSASVLPKCKAPGTKWRLIVNKHATPTRCLHSLTSRAVDVLFDTFPKHYEEISSPCLI